MVRLEIPKERKNIAISAFKLLLANHEVHRRFVIFRLEKQKKKHCFHMRDLKEKKNNFFFYFFQLEQYESAAQFYTKILQTEYFH